MFIFLPKWHKRYSKITIHVYIILYHLKITIHVYIYIINIYIYIIPNKKIPRYVSCNKNSWSPQHFFREPFLRASNIPKVVGHTRLIQITSATFGALLVPFHTVTMLPIEAGRRKRKGNPPRFVIILWVNSIVFVGKR